MKPLPACFAPFALLGFLVLAGCQSAYYGTMEKFGVHKRDILVDRVESARTAQQQAKEQFASALDQFLAVTKVDGGDLKKKHDTLAAALQRSEDRAQAVRERLGAIDSVARALFSEWKNELKQYTNAELRTQSERQLEATRVRYEALQKVMSQAAERMDPVLRTFRDQVLFLKHNLNAQALASLDATARGLEKEIGQLIAEMEASIREAEAFIREMKSTP